MKNGQKLNPHWGLFLSAVLRSIFGAGVFIEGWARLQFYFFRKRKAFAPKPASLPSCRHFACERDRGQFGCLEKGALDVTSKTSRPPATWRRSERIRPV